MKKRNLPQNEKNERVRRERDPIPWRYCFLTLLCGGILVVGFFFAARQHFSAISLGMKNSELRKQRDDLQTEQRSLKVLREIAFSPAELEKAARSIGLEKISNAAYDFAGVGNKTAEKPKSSFARSSKPDKTDKFSGGGKLEKIESKPDEAIKNDHPKTAKKDEKPAKSESEKKDVKLDKKGK